MARTEPRHGVQTRTGPPQNLAKSRRSNSLSPELKQRIKSGASTTDAGAVDEDQFRAAFEDFPVFELMSGSEVDKELMAIHRVLSNTTEDWEKRIDQVSYF